MWTAQQLSARIRPHTHAVKAMVRHCTAGTWLRRPLSSSRGYNVCILLFSKRQIIFIFDIANRFTNRLSLLCQQPVRVLAGECGSSDPWGSPRLVSRLLLVGFPESQGFISKGSSCSRSQFSFLPPPWWQRMAIIIFHHQPKQRNKQ